MFIFRRCKVLIDINRFTGYLKLIMSTNYEVTLANDKTIFVADIVLVAVDTSMPISGDAIGEKWIFFYSVDPPVTMDDVPLGIALTSIASFSEVS